MTITYDELTAEIIANTENDGAEFAAQTDNFIKKAEALLSRDLDVPSLTAHKTTNMTIGDQFLTRPDNCLTVRHLNLTDGSSVRHPVRQRTPELLRTYWERTNVTGRPKYYAEWSESQILLAPPPDVAYTTEISFEARIDGLSSSNATNFYSTYFEDLLFALCMYYAESFDKNHAAAAKWYGQEGQGGYKDLLIGAKRDVARFYADEFSTGPSV